MSGSVFETFYFLFSSNADDVEKGNKKAKDSSDKLEESLKDTEKETKSSGKAFLGLADGIKRAAIAYLSYKSIEAAVVASVQHAEGLRIASMAINENIADIDAWGRATRQFGGDAATLQNTLKSLNTNIRETAFMGEGSLSPVLRRLGLNLRDLSGNIKTPLQLLPEVAKSFERFSKAEAMHLGNLLGLDEATVMLLLKGKSGVDELVKSQKALGSVTEKDTEEARKFNMQLAETGTVFLLMRQRLVTSALPALTWFFEKLEVIGKWMNDNDELVEGFFIGAALAITAYYLPAVISAAAATLAATWPILAIIAVIGLLVAAFAVVYDEIKNFANGQNSMIGEALKRWPMLGKAIELVGDYIKWLVGLFKWLGQFMYDSIFHPTKAFQSWMDMVGAMGDKMVSVSKIIKGAIDAFLFPLKMAMNLAEKSGLFEGSKIDASVENDLTLARSSILTASTTPIASQTSSSIINNTKLGSNTTVDIGQVTVVTQATDSAQISTAIGVSLKEQLQLAVFNADDGVAY